MQVPEPKLAVNEGFRSNLRVMPVDDAVEPANTVTTDPGPCVTPVVPSEATEVSGRTAADVMSVPVLAAL